MKINYYKKPSISFFVFITSVLFALFVSACGTEKSEIIEDPSNPSITSDDIFEKVAAATQVAGKYFHECNSISELEQHLDEIRKKDGIVDVWTNDMTMYVEIDGWGVINYNYPEVPDDEVLSTTRFVDEETICKAFTNNTGSPSTRAVFDITHEKLHHRTNDQESPSFVIYNATYTDHSTITKEANDIARELEALYKDDMNIETTLIQDKEKSSVDFFSNEISNYDIAFIIAHGLYDNERYFRHRIITGEMIGIGESLSEDIIMEFIRSKNYWKYTARQPTDNLLNEEEKMRIRQEKERNAMLAMDCVKEIDANGNEQPVYYVSLYERFFSEQMLPFNKKTIVFCTACHSLEGNQNLGRYFCEKGAAFYLGYDNKNAVGHRAGRDFFKGLLEGWSALSSYNNLDGDYRHDRSNNASLMYVTRSNNEEDEHVCIVHPETVSYEDGDDSVILRGSIKIANPNNNNEYGFALLDKNTKEVKPIETRIKYSRDNVNCKYSETKHTLTFECSVEKSLFKDVDQFCAYLYEGERYCLGDFKDIEIQDMQMFAEYDSGTNTMTFRYGNKPNNKVYDLSSALHKLSDINRIVFDKSVSNAKPEIFMNIGTWFNNLIKVEEIVGLGYINSSLVTNMKSMFEGCSRLKYVDIDGLNTSQVTSMMWMFMGCSSLTNIDLGNLDTSNVMDMNGMFLNCNSLTNIDLGNLDTSNVMDMSGMFGDCNNLTTLNLNSFNTSQVKDMSAMFRDCTSLTTLNLSSFNTSQVKDMSIMFRNCTSLTTLNLSSFNTSQVTTMSFMFSGCSSLSTLDLRSFNTSQVTNMSAMFYCCSNLTTVLHNFDTSNVIHKDYIFGGCDKLTDIGLFGK